MESSPSRTALVASLMRALHSRRNSAPLLDDPWGELLVPLSERESMRDRILARMSEEERKRARQTPEDILDDFLESNAAFPGVIIRSRYAEDALRDAMRRGIRQYILIGAGFDSFALRQPAFSDGLKIFEIDHPATQGLKIRRIRDCGVSLPSTVHFLSADLATEEFSSVLARSTFRKDEPAFFAWLGVTVYLTREANLATLRSVAKTGAPGSELVFTYVDRILFAPNGGRPPGDSNTELVAAIGEPFLSSFDPAGIKNDLMQAGLQLIEDLDGRAMSQRYERAGSKALQAADNLHVVLARVP
jgi:methyltransferase (TIGR00027 family)